MESVVSILSGSATLGSLALVAYLVIELLKAKDAATDARVQMSTVTEQAAEANYKLTQVQLALASALKLNDAQAKELNDAIGAKPNPDLPADDVHDRIVRWLSQNTSTSTDSNAGSAPGTAVPQVGTATKA